MVRKQWVTCLTIAKNYRGDKIGKAIKMDSAKERGKKNDQSLFPVECVPTHPHHTYKIPAF